MLEQLLHSSGFLYEIGGSYYFLGKWICKRCADTDASDCVVTYHMCRASGELPEASLYFEKIRAYSDFALEIPYNPAKIRKDMEQLLDSLSESEQKNLEQQFLYFQEDSQK